MQSLLTMKLRAYISCSAAEVGSLKVIGDISRGADPSIISVSLILGIGEDLDDVIS